MSLKFSHIMFCIAGTVLVLLMFQEPKNYVCYNKLSGRVISNVPGKYYKTISIEDNKYIVVPSSEHDLERNLTCFEPEGDPNIVGKDLWDSLNDKK